jgi:hypothetical protein
MQFRCAVFLGFALGVAGVACGTSVGPTDGNVVDVVGVDASSETGADVPTDRGVTSRVPRYHRATAEVCPTTRPPSMCTFPGGGPPVMCRTDVDCMMGTNGRCLNSMGGPAGCFCSYDQCGRDTDCMGMQLCACRGSQGIDPVAANLCVAAGCRVDTDCGAGGYCSPSRAGGCGGVTGFYCHTASDQCVDDTDCGPGGVTSILCGYQSMNHRWECIARQLCP